MMRRAAILATLLLGTPTLGLADGLPSGSAGYCCEAPTWSGVYAGFQAGGAWGDSGWTFPFVESFNVAPGQHFSVSPGGALVGGQLGVNQQIGAFLIGGEVAFVGTDWHETQIGPASFPQDRFKTVISNLVTVTGRAGVPFGNHLLYGKAGWANGNVDVSAVSGTTGISADVTQRQDGWTAGAGWEYRIGRSLVFGVEYDYVDLSGGRFTTSTGGATPGLPFNVNLDDLHMHSVTARLSLLLDRGPTSGPTH